MWDLLDLNVLVALFDPQHENHRRASEWLYDGAFDGWASCPLTENGCLRLLTNPRYKSPLTAAAVLGKLAEMKRDIPHRFWPDDLSITDPAIFDWTRLRGHQQITDVYLLALAAAHGGRLVTFDQKIPLDLVVGSRPEHLLMLTAQA